jgi:hypothetical protein
MWEKLTMADLDPEQMSQAILELENSQGHLHLTQPKLYTLFTHSFHLLLQRALSERGAYLLRLEDAALASKLIKRAKSAAARKCLEKVLIARKVALGKSLLYLDYFAPNSWGQTMQQQTLTWKMALVVNHADPHQVADPQQAPLSSDLYLTPMCSIFEKICWVAFEQQAPAGFQNFEFSFIKKELDDEENEQNGDWKDELEG